MLRITIQLNKNCYVDKAGKRGELNVKGGCCNEIWNIYTSGYLFPVFARSRVHNQLPSQRSGDGRVYYTTDYDRTNRGAVVFEDAKTRHKVTLQSSDINEVSRMDFEAGRRN
jgi:hypothetical protein